MYRRNTKACSCDFWHICTVFDKDEVCTKAKKTQITVYLGTLTAELRAPATLWNVLNTRFHAAVYARRPANYIPSLQLHLRYLQEVHCRPFLVGFYGALSWTLRFCLSPCQGSCSRVWNHLLLCFKAEMCESLFQSIVSRGVIWIRVFKYIGGFSWVRVWVWSRF